MKKVKSENPAAYNVKANKHIISKSEQVIIDKAQKIILARFSNSSEALTSPAMTGQYLQVLLAGEKSEVFAMVSLDNRNHPLAYTELFNGTIDGCSVYPREVVKQALQDNAAAVIFCHNHPSGITDPSQADITITERLKKALALIDVRVLDHVIVGKSITYFSELGLI